MELFLGLLVVIAVAWFFLHRSGNPHFWRLAARYPDEAYDWFKSDACWVVMDSDTSSPPEARADYAGPFFLCVPKLGNRRVTVYGHHKRLEESQRQFAARLSGRPG